MGSRQSGILTTMGYSSMLVSFANQNRLPSGAVSRKSMGESPVGGRFSLVGECRA